MEYPDNDLASAEPIIFLDVALYGSRYVGHGEFDVRELLAVLRDVLE